MEVRELLELLLSDGVLTGTLSHTRNAEYGERIRIRPVQMKDGLKYQAERYTKTQVFHENLMPQELVSRVEAWLKTDFRQGEFSCGKKAGLVLVSKKGKATVKLKNAVTVSGDDEAGQGDGADLPQEKSYAHNREKQYLLKEGVPVDFLVGLGVQTADGRVVKNRYDKFRQINRYLEYIEDVLEVLPKDRTIRIIDFGCGKSYLTFAMYYYLKVLNGRDIEVIGLDLKKDVIAHCNALAKECGYENLHFLTGDIAHYRESGEVDMVVSLHACDTATKIYPIEWTR